MVSPKVTIKATITADGLPARTSTAVLTVTTTVVMPPRLAGLPSGPSTFGTANPLLATGPAVPNMSVELPTVVQDPKVAGQSVNKMIRLTALEDGTALFSSRERLSLLVGLHSGWLALLLLAGTVVIVRIGRAASSK